jgi:predicted metal-dependent peptidase
MENNLAPEKKLTKARALLILDMPFFGNLSLKLKLEENKFIPTCATDGISLLYNPAFIDKLSIEETKGLVCHEIMHVACNHHTRRNARDMRKWNIAADYAINQLIVGTKFSDIKLPKGGLLDEKYNGMSAEEIYSKLPVDNNNKKNSKGNGKGNGNNNDNDGQGGGDGDSNEDDNNEDIDPGMCGAVIDAKNKDGKAASSAEKAHLEQEWKIAIQQAAQQAKAMGNMSAGFDRFIGEIVNPKLDWKSILRRFVQDSIKNDYSWFPPNRRFVYQNLYLPSLRSDGLGEIVIAVDTSGSVSNDEIKQFAGEITAIMEEYNYKITVIYCDTEVNDVEEFDNEQVILHPKGGGGTDFIPPFEWLENNNRVPTCFIYMTDLYCNSFPKEPEYPVLWVNTGSDDNHHVPFGEIIKL